MPKDFEIRFDRGCWRAYAYCYFSIEGREIMITNVGGPISKSDAKRLAAWMAKAAAWAGEKKTKGGKK